jgi:uncharacterized protein
MGRFAVVFCWVIAALMSSPMSARAAPVEWLYDVDVPVTDQSADVRGAAFKQALLVALKRMSGFNEVPMNPAVASALESPQRFYVEYRYRQEDNPIAGAMPAKVLMLSVRFAENAIQKLIAEAGLPLWSSNRPTTLAWIVVADGETRTVLSASDRSPLSNALRARALERGLPLVLPLMDPDEQLEVSGRVVWGGMTSMLELASERYTPDQILVGRVTHGANNSWGADWQFSEHGNQQQFKFDSPSAEAAAAAVVDRLVDQLVARYAVSSGTQERLQIQVNGIAGVTDYGALLKYLGGLEFIDSVRIEEVRPDVVLLSLETHTPWDRLRDLLALDGRLAASEQIEVGTVRRVLIWRGDLHR